MIIGIFLNSGDSFSNQKKSGRDGLFLSHLQKLSPGFSKIYIFSYGSNENIELPANCVLISNKYKVHRYLYGFLLFFIERKKIKKCQVFRVMQLTGSLPVIISYLIYKKPFVVTYGFDYQKFAQIAGQKWQILGIRILEQIGLKMASGIIVTTKNLKDKLYQYGNKVILIPNGVDINKFKCQMSKLKATTQNLKLKKIEVLFIGRLEKQKNLEMFIEAIGQSRYKKQINLIFIGQGSLKDNLKKTAESLKVNLEIIDKIPHNELPEVYNQADIFVLPSLIEGNPKVLLEAMACGLSCIGTDVEGISNIIENGVNGLLCRLNSGDMTDKIDKLISNSDLRKKLGKNARQFIVQNFNSNKLIKKEIKILKNAV